MFLFSGENKEKAKSMFLDIFIEKKVEIKDAWLTIPNIITLLGTALTALYVYMYVAEFAVVLIPVVIFFIALSDVLDGLAARILDQHTYVGKIIDPLRDRVFGLALVGNIVVAAGSPVVYAMVGAIIVFEVLIGFVNIRYEKRHRTGGRVHTMGKIRMLVHIVCAGLFVFNEYWMEHLPSNMQVDFVRTELILGIMLISSVFAFLSYAKGSFKNV